MVAGCQGELRFEDDATLVSLCAMAATLHTRQAAAVAAAATADGDEQQQPPPTQGQDGPPLLLPPYAEARHGRQWWAERVQQSSKRLADVQVGGGQACVLPQYVGAVYG